MFGITDEKSLVARAGRSRTGKRAGKEGGDENTDEAETEKVEDCDRLVVCSGLALGQLSMVCLEKGMGMLVAF